MADALSDLPPLKWGDLPEVPCDSAPYDFSHSMGERRWPYVDGAGHDPTGLDPIPVKVKLYFLNTMFGFGNLYTEAWPIWRPALFDGALRLLEHPDLGSFTARVPRGHVDFTAQTRSGVVVEVDFISSLADPETALQFTAPATDPGAAAAAADVAWQALGFDYPDGLNETDLLGAWNSIKGQVLSASMTITGKLNQVMGIVSGMIEDLRTLNDPTLQPHSVLLVALWNSLRDYRDGLNKGARATAQQTTRRPTTLSEFAATVGNDLDEIIGLNLSALRTPTVPAGSVLTYYIK